LFDKGAEVLADEDHELTELRRYMEALADKDDLTLVQAAAGWKESTAKHRAIMIELARRAKRREQSVAWFAMGVSVVSLVLAIAALVLRH